MNFLYRNDTGKAMKFELGGSDYLVLPSLTIEIPEKYDYAIELMKLRLTKLYSQSIELDKSRHPEEWIVLSTEELISKIESERAQELSLPEVTEIKTPEPKKKGRRKKE